MGGAPLIDRLRMAAQSPGTLLFFHRSIQLCFKTHHQASREIISTEGPSQKKTISKDSSRYSPDSNTSIELSCISAYHRKGMPIAILTIAIVYLACNI